MTADLHAFDITDYQTKAEQGDAEAQCQLGVCYAQGKGVEKNLAQSARYWLMASKQHHPQALVYLGKLFEKGVAVPQDFGKAVQCYQSAIAQNSAEAKVYLAMLYLQGNGVVVDEKQAVSLLIQSAEQANPIAQFQLGQAYEYGLGGLTQNVEQAQFWYNQSAEQDYEPAKQALQQVDNQTNPNDNAEDLFNQGVESLQTNIGEAINHFAKSAEQNFAKAQYNTALAYLFAVGGVDKDVALATEFLQKSAEQDFRPAHFVLGWLYQMENQPDKAVLHYQKAGELGHAQAQYFLSKLYEAGNGVAQNDETALTWLRQSAKQGYGLAYQRLEQLIP